MPGPSRFSLNDPAEFIIFTARRPAALLIGEFVAGRLVELARLASSGAISPIVCVSGYLYILAS